MFFTQEPEFLNALNVNLGFFFATSVIFLVLFILSRRENKKLRATNKEQAYSFLFNLSEVKESIDKIVEGQRLSTILKIEPAILKIDPAQFEPKKEVIRMAVLSEWEDHKGGGIGPDTKSYCILYHSGFAYFLKEGESRSRMQESLTRLITNQDEEVVKSFLEVIINAL